MRAVLVTQPGRPASVETVADPSPARDEVVISVSGCGICGTDRHILDEGLPTVRYPLIPGHEPWGEIVAVGSEVRGLAPGRLVAVDPALFCGICPRCHRGMVNLCERFGSIGGTRPGAWAEYTAVPAANIHPLPEGYPTDVASLIEPVACAVRGLERLAPRADRSALIYGGGAMGLILAILLETRGVAPITIVEADPDRRRIGSRVTGARVLAPGELDDAAEMEQVVEATGVPAVLEESVRHVAPGGTLLIFGVSSPDAQAAVPPFRIYQRELTVVGSMAIRHTFAPAVDVVSRHAERLRPLLTHRFGLERFDDAVRALSDGRSVKVTIIPGET
jgi:2-desacetyl-2-hydroxyethyl bacteriochlorophyllide A dehydrogenase